MDLGKAERFFTPAQIKRLWLRDRHCTYPGCDAPASWTDAHHLIHWADGGPSDLNNAALLCQRHHTTVHSQRYHGWIEPDHNRRSHVVWDRTRGAYNHALAQLDSGLGRNHPAESDGEAPPDHQRASGDPDIWHRR